MLNSARLFSWMLFELHQGFVEYLMHIVVIQGKRHHFCDLIGGGTPGSGISHAHCCVYAKRRHQEVFAFFFN